MPLINQFPFNIERSITVGVGDRLQIDNSGVKYGENFIPAGNGSFHFEYESVPNGGDFDNPYDLTYLVPDDSGHIDYYQGLNIQGLNNLTHYVITVLNADGSAPSQSAPITAEDSFKATAGYQGTFSNALLLSNDFDPNNDVLKIVELTATSGNATAELNYTFQSDGNFSVNPGSTLPDGSPDPTFEGIVDLEYVVSDSRGGLSTGTAHITFNATQHKPVAVSEAYATGYQTLLKIDLPGGVLANDSDADGNALIANLKTGPAHGTLDLNQDGSFSYTPEAGYSGKDSFIYAASDGTYASANTTVEISVGAAPQAPQGSFMTLTAGADDASYANSKVGMLIQAMGGDDSVTGSRFDDSLNGGAGTDFLRGGAGKDFITGGAGFDRVSGGIGNDTFAFAKGDLVNPQENGGRMDQIIDFHGAGVGGSGENDFLRFSGFGKGALEFDHDLGGEAHTQIYKVMDEAGAYQGSLIVQMADSTKHLAAGDYAFA